MGELRDLELHSYIRVKNFRIFVHAISSIEYNPEKEVIIHLSNGDKFEIRDEYFDELMGDSKTFHTLVFGDADKVVWHVDYPAPL